MSQSNGLMPTFSSVPSNMSLLQQPFVQITDQTSIHSMPATELTQPMLLINPQHVRGISEVTTPDAMLQQQQQHHHQQLANLQEMPRPPSHHARASSLQIPMNAGWDLNGSQWATSTLGPMGGVGQIQQATPPSALAPQPSGNTPDPFDELAMNSRSAKGK